jgi:hypothetical protein
MISRTARSPMVALFMLNALPEEPERFDSPEGEPYVFPNPRSTG